MLASIVLAAVAAAAHPAAFDGADLICRPGGGASLRVWRGEEARPQRALDHAAPGGATFVVTLSTWTVRVLPLDGPTTDVGLQVIDDATPGYVRSSSTLLSCGRGGAGPVRLRLDPSAPDLASADQPRRLR